MTLFKTTTVKESKREKGIALIFTLIMLSLLLILALSFALDSMFEQKAAYNSASASSAELMTQSQLQEVLSLVQNGSANLSKTTWSRDINYDYTAAALDYHTDQLRERLNVTGLLDDNNNTTAWAPDGVNWNYTINEADTNKPIVGRTAFVIIPDEKIPLPSLVDERDGGTAEYPTQNEEEDSETRIGKYVSEINVRNTIPKTIAAHSSTDIDAIADYMNWKQNGSVGFPNGRYQGTWGSYDDLYTILEKPSSPFTFSGNDKDEFQTNLTISRTNEAEAFWMDTNNNEKVDDGELYRRFDLTRDDWDKQTWDEDLVFLRKEILLLNTADNDRTSQTPVNSLQIWDESDGTATTSGLPWLAFFGYLTDGNEYSLFKGTFDSVYSRRAQIAANLKDYCDRDKNSSGLYTNSDLTPVVRPTSDKDPAKWLTEEPAFTGNEQTPYINKVGVEIKLTRSDSTVSTFNVAKITVDAKPYVELINIYNSTLPTTGLKVRVKGSVSCTIAGSEPVTVPIDQEIDLSGWTATAQSYSQFAEGDIDDSSGSVIWDDSNLTVKIDSVRIDKIVLYKGTTTPTVDYVGYDYTKQLATAPSLPDAFDGADGDSSTSWYGWAVHDPRQNLNQKDWECLSPQKTSDPSDVLSLEWDSVTSQYVGHPNCKNSTWGTGTDTENPSARDPFSTSEAVFGDKESSEDPAKLSTNFIRNAPMQSPWELGFIHRAKRWQTINLKQYYKDKAYKPMTGKSYLAGGDIYYTGDANILDQIKMTHNATSPQKINLNSTSDITFQALLGKLKYGCNIDANMSVYSMAGIANSTLGISASGTELLRGDTVTNTIANNILTKYNPATTTVPENERKTRASIVDKLRLPMTTPAIAATNDATQEELIGKVVNLTKTGNQAGHFTIIVVSQTIKDVGGASSSAGIPITKYSIDGTKVATKNDCKIGTFDANISSTNNNESIYFDEITATKKIIFKGRTLGASKIKILGMEYAD